MLQIQYYNKGLSKTQIEQIIKNYNIKYTRLTNEINLKLNSIIKTVLNDITPFLENIEYLAKQAKQIKEIENANDRIDILENKLKEKALQEKELQNNISYLKQEIKELKEKEKEYEKNIKLKDDLLKNIENKQTNQRANYTSKKIKKNVDKHISSNSLDYLEINREIKSSRTEEENDKKNNNNINTSLKKLKRKNINKWNKDKNNKYMMNLKEITRNLNIYHEHAMMNKNSHNINQFISSSNQKEEKKEIKNKKRIVHSIDGIKYTKNKDMRLSSDINHISRFEINKEEIESNNENNRYIICDEDINEEIKQLEIDEQNILKLIDKINNFGNDK